MLSDTATRRWACLLAISVTSALASSPAAAYRLWLEPDRDVTTMEVGDTVSVDLHLDTQGATGIALFSVGVFFDPTILTYHVDRSWAEPYALYSPAGGKGDPATWLAPDLGVPLPWPVNAHQVNVDFVANTVASPASRGTQIASDDVLLATLFFEMTAPGDAGILLAIGAGNVLSGYPDGETFSEYTDELALSDPIGLTSTDWIAYCTPSGRGHPYSPCIYDPDALNGYGGPVDPDQGGGDDDGGGGDVGDNGPPPDPDPGPDPGLAVPEPTAALLFGIGLIVLQRGRRPMRGVR